VSAIFDRRFLIVIGKGGVGKTTVSAAIAMEAARRGKRVLVAMCHTKERLSELYNVAPIDDKVRTVLPNIDAVNMSPETALTEYGVIVLKSKTLANTIFGNRFVAAFLKGVPGLDAWTMLGKAYYHATTVENGRPEYDMVILDAPATGHGLDMLRVPKVLMDVAPPGLLRREAEKAWSLFQDAERSGVVLVSLAEEMPANETIELYAAVTSELKLPVARLVLNAVLPPLFSAEERKEICELPKKLSPGTTLASLVLASRARALREGVQEDAEKRLDDTLKLERTNLPYIFTAAFDRNDVEQLSHAFATTS
jgi:anion-transporting  ArsA/GET3 family ATPase